MKKSLQSADFKRQEIQQRLEKRIEAFQKGYRQNVGILSPPGYGKSAILQSIYERFSSAPDLICVFIQAETLDFDHLADRWIESLLAACAIQQGIAAPEQGHILLALMESTLPVTCEKVKGIKKMIRRGDRNASCIRELFSLSGVVAAETRKKVLVILDEFHALENLPAPDPFALLGKEMMIEKETLYLVSSSRPRQAQEIFHHKLSLLFGNFEVVELTPLGFDEAMEFLTERPLPMVLTEFHKSFLMRLTDGNVRYLDFILERIETVLLRKGNGSASMIQPLAAENIRLMPDDIVIEAVLEELLNERGRLFLLFEQKLDVCRRFGKDASPFIRVLLAISAGRRRVMGIATYIERKMRETKKVLQRLVQEEIIAKRGAFYVLEDPLFRFWLQEVFARRNHLIAPQAGKLKQGLLDTLIRMLELSHTEKDMDVTARVETLFKEFRNDMLEVEHHRIRCPQFTEVAFKPANGRLFPVMARKANLRWLCQVAKYRVHEEDVILFKEEIRRHRKKIQRKILIALSGIDQNAKLMAQEAEIQIWDLRNFNTLLDLYNLPKMIPTRGINESDLGAMAQSLFATQ